MKPDHIIRESLFFVCVCVWVRNFFVLFFCFELKSSKQTNVVVYTSLSMTLTILILVAIILHKDGRSHYPGFAIYVYIGACVTRDECNLLVNSSKNVLFLWTLDCYSPINRTFRIGL